MGSSRRLARPSSSLPHHIQTRTDGFANFFYHWRTLPRRITLRQMPLEIFTLCDAATEHAGAASSSAANSILSG